MERLIKGANFYGFVAEWLGRGLQNLLQRFESARNLECGHLIKTAFWRFFLLPEILGPHTIDADL
jgi:hypothetical protein